ncbi:MAG: hypothetical protein IKB20_02550 [Clostridia bacterium]|nr:hypothetical protein [Clostridia bacterium]
MKKFLSLLLCVLICTNFIACSSEQGAQGEMGISPKIEISEDGYWIINGQKTEYKAANNEETTGFVVGKKQHCTLGENFVIFAYGGIPVEIKTSIVAYKEADINNINDYQRNQSQFYRYIYKGTLSGKVDKLYAGKQVRIYIDYSWNVQYDNPGPSDGINIDDNGNFEIDFIVFSHSDNISYSIREVSIR